MCAQGVVKGKYFQRPILVAIKTPGGINVIADDVHEKRRSSIYDSNSSLFWS